MTLTDSQPNERIKIKLEFVKPFKRHQRHRVHLQARGGWDPRHVEHGGHKNFISKAFCMFIDMDKMVGDQFDKGLNQIRAEVEPVKGEPATRNRRRCREMS